MIEHMKELNHSESYRTTHTIQDMLGELLHQEDSHNLHSHECALREVLLFLNIISEEDVKCHTAPTSLISGEQDGTYRSFQILYELSLFLQVLPKVYEGQILTAHSSQLSES